MSRPPRIDLPGYPQHVIQRGNNRNPCFFEASDYLKYLRSLQRAALKSRCTIHAYVLMTNHVHLLVTPTVRGGVSKLMQSLGRRYVLYVNKRHKRSGTLWEGRFKSSLVDTDGYLLACYRYIELNPVRASMVAAAAEYPWSSYRHNALGADDPLIGEHPLYQELGQTAMQRRAAYRQLFDQVVDKTVIEAIRSNANQNKVLGSEHFIERLSALLNRPVGLASRGRPKKVL